MATFATKKTGIRPPITSWEYYVEDKDDWERYKDILKVETKKPGFLWVKLKGGLLGGDLVANAPSGWGAGQTYKNGDKVTLLDNSSHNLPGEKTIYALVEIRGNKGLLPITKLGKPSRNTTAVEDVALAQLDSAIKKRAIGGKGICIVTTDHHGHIAQMFKDVVRARTNKGTPKSDFSMINSTGQVVSEISHKKEGGPEAYQQYSGITQTAGASIADDSLVHDALRLFVDRYSLITVEKLRFKFKIPWNKKGKLLMNRAIYGPDFGGRFGIDNVNFIGQGKPVIKEYTRQPTNSHDDCIKECGIVYELTFSSNISMNGDLSHFKSGGYEPYIIARYTGGRTFQVDNEKYRDIRVLIAPTTLSRRAGVVPVE